MRKLILIKHSAPEVVPGTPSEAWRLSDEGIKRCAPLAEFLEGYLPFSLVCSEETKAVETAAQVAKQLNITHETAPDLEEHDRSNVPYMPSAQFISMMELFFRKPKELVLGAETADTALARLRSAIDEIITQKGEQDVAVISHGTVIALFVAHCTGKPGFQLWRQMGLPSLAVFSLPGFNLIQLVEKF